MQLKDYQENAIEELLEKTKRLMVYSGEKKLVFKAPTGSGKTIMMAEFLKRLVDDREVRLSLSFIWTAPRQLHIQSRGKLENYFENTRALKCSFFEDLTDKKIGEDEILFFNWESINKEDNIYIRDNEQDFNLSNVLERTKEDNREIILVIDEAHHHATSEISRKLISDISPRLTIEVSATPVIESPDEMVNVQIEAVKAESMIKKAIILNEQFVNLLKQGKIESSLSSGSEALVIEAALKKRLELSKAFSKEKTIINPLVLIQLPDRIGQLEDTMKERVIRILKDKHNIFTDNGKLAIWLSGEHVNKEDIEKHTSEVEVLIFKQAIALGWDCPRAQILVLFREWHSPIFSIQTIGRIMRMPEPTRGHYEGEILNFGYVYTNLSAIEIHEDIARDYITTFRSKRHKNYAPIDLLSCHAQRHREKTRLSPLFIEIFLKEARSYGLKDKIDAGETEVDIKLISDYIRDNIDTWAGSTIVGDKHFKAGAVESQRLFDYFVRRNLTPFYPEDRSVGRVKEAIYKFFESECKMKRGEDEELAIQTTLNERNNQEFINIIDKSKAEYQKETLKREPEIVYDDHWTVPESIPFGSEYVLEENIKKSVMEPFYSDEKWKSESAFIQFLEKDKNVEWWFKNGDRDTTFFAVPYDNGEIKPFYVDFIVKFKDSRIGLFDTKAGFTQKIAGPKIEGLRKYIEQEGKKGKKLIGGIVTNTDQRNYQGRWIIFNKPSKELIDNDFSNWETLEL